MEGAAREIGPPFPSLGGTGMDKSGGALLAAPSSPAGLGAASDVAIPWVTTGTSNIKGGGSEAGAGG